MLLYSFKLHYFNSNRGQSGWGTTELLTFKVCASPTRERPRQAGVVLDALPGHVYVHHGLRDGLAVVDHFQFCDVVPSFLWKNSGAKGQSWKKWPQEVSQQFRTGKPVS